MILKAVWSKFQIYGIALVGVVISALVVTVRLLTKRNSRLSRRVENAEANLNHARVVLTQDINISEQTDSHRTNIINEGLTDNENLPDNETSDDSYWANPDRMWNDTDT